MPKAQQISNEPLRRKLSAVTNTQVSITGLSTWILHNRKNGESIVNAWVTQLSKSDHEHRLTLLYVANDVVQNCRKKAPEMKDVWRRAMKPAFEHLTHHSIRSGLMKVVAVWENRQVFDKATVDELRTILTTAKNKHKDKGERALKDFKPNDLVEALKEYSNCENDLRLKRELLSSSGLDESDPEKLLDKVKERGQGQRARQELEQWTQLLLEYVDLQETAIERRRKLLSLLDQSCIFYQAQFHEVNVVLKAYKDYQERVLSQKRRCQEMMTSRYPKKFQNMSPVPSGENSPVPSPVQDMQMSEPESSSDDEPIAPLSSFFVPTECGDSSASNLAKGSIGPDGDLDSRLANILNSGTTGESTQLDKTNDRKSRWDSGNTDNSQNGESSHIPPPPMPGWVDQEEDQGWNENGNIPPDLPPQNSGWEPNGAGQQFNGGPPAPFNSPPPSSPRFPVQPRFSGPPISSPRFGNHDSPRFGGDRGQRGGLGHRGDFRGRFHDRGGFSGPRTPQGQRPPRPPFHSEGGGFRGRGRGDFRGGHRGFTPRGNRGNFRGRFPN